MVLMEKIHWGIFVATIILLSAMCKFSVHLRHFNLFILGLFFIIFGVVVVFWLSFKWTDHKNEELIQENNEEFDE
jgi:Ca2+/Na+ antiporter